MNCELMLTYDTISDFMIILSSGTMFLYVLIFCGFLCGCEGTTFMYTYFIEMFYFQQSISAKKTDNEQP
jgi:hypothetical protein